MTTAPVHPKVRLGANKALTKEQRRLSLDVYQNLAKAGETTDLAKAQYHVSEAYRLVRKLASDIL